MSSPQDPFGPPGEGDRPADASSRPVEGQGQAGQPQYGQPQSGQPQYDQDQYGAPPQYGQGNYGQQPTNPKNGLGIAAMVLGILAMLTILTVFGGILFGLIAVVLGFVARGKVKKGEATNGAVALSGIITGGLALLLSIGLIIFGVSLLNSDSFNNLQDCLNDAGNDTAAQEQCETDFSDNFGN